jgi:DnaK suppressor protein
MADAAPLRFCRESVTMVCELRRGDYFRLHGAAWHGSVGAGLRYRARVGPLLAGRSDMAIPKVTIPKEVFRERLQVERQRLLDALAAQESNGLVSGKVVGGEHAGYGNHMADDASEIFEQEKNLALQQNLKDLLAKTERALRKFDSGTYGVCEDCGESIDPARLEALPWAAHCIRCKQKAQKRP